MRQSERLVIYALLAIAIVFSVQSARFLGTPAGASMLVADDVDEPRIAVCSVPSLLNQLMESDRFRPAREDLEADLREGLEKLVTELRELEAKGDGLGEDDPTMPGLVDRYRELRQRLAQGQQEMAQAMEAINANQLVEAHDLIRASASAVAEDLGFNYVISTLDDQEELNRDSIQIVFRQILARPVLFAPADADITDDVREDLRLE